MLNLDFKYIPINPIHFERNSNSDQYQPVANTGYEWSELHHYTYITMQLVFHRYIVKSY